jgi:glycosyltransferase involved in cell wall biosynthesis
MVRPRRTYIASLLAKVDCCVFPSQAAHNAFSCLYSAINEGRSMVIPNGICRKIYRPGPIAVKEKDSDLIRVAFLGNFCEHKGNRPYLELAAALGQDPRFQFYILGNCPEQLPKSLRKQVKALGGYKVDSLGDMFRNNQIDLVALFSPWPETFSYTLSEAVAQGIPVIATDLGALRERVSGLGVGVLVDHKNPVPMSRQFLEEMSANREILHFFQQRCRAALSQIPDTKEMIDNYDGLYGDYLGNDIIK